MNIPFGMVEDIYFPDMNVLSAFVVVGFKRFQLLGAYIPPNEGIQQLSSTLMEYTNNENMDIIILGGFNSHARWVDRREEGSVIMKELLNRMNFTVDLLKHYHQKIQNKGTCWSHIWHKWC